MALIKSNIFRYIAALLAFLLIFPIVNVSAENNTLSPLYIQKDEITLSVGDALELNVSVPKSGDYAIQLDYLVLSGNAELGISVDGMPLLDGEFISLFTLWVNEENDFAVDNQNNDIRPLQIRYDEYYTMQLYDRTGGADKKLIISLTQGVHSFKITASSGKFKLRSMLLCEETEQLSYNEYKNNSFSDSTQNFYKKIQAEKATVKSNSAFYPSNDNNTPSVEPSDATAQKLNIIGGQSYSEQGHFLEWSVDVPSDGLYTISFKFRQNSKRGMVSNRRLRIDGEVLFEELDCIAFPYDGDWQQVTVGDDEPYDIYLNKGTHRITLEVVPGEIGLALYELEKFVHNMNETYRNIIMVTSTSPDTLRDYNLDKEIPGLMDNIQQLRNDLSSLLKRLESLASDKGSECAFINEIVDMFDDFIEDPDEIQKRLSDFSTHASSLAQYVVNGMAQPLELDYLIVASCDEMVKMPKAGFFETIIFRMKRFVTTFISDYGDIGSVDGTSDSMPLNVWMSISDVGSGSTIGRDQAQVLKRLINRTYSVETGKSVNLSLVSSGTILMQAIMAGKGPDIALFSSKEFPGNLALRDAVVNLDTLDGIDEIKSRFNPALLKPFTLEGNLYALPETQSYSMLFYRTDIFEDLGISVPDTWDEFYNIIYKIQKKNLMVGVPVSYAIYDTILLQNNGRRYSEDMSEITLIESEGIEAFEKWCELYNVWQLPYSFDGFNRFRTGEMPLYIGSTAFANQLWAAAPELNGLWGISPIPGTVTEDGIDRTEVFSVTGAVIINRTKQLDAAFEFLDWWTTKETQKIYSEDVESTLGKSARHIPANTEACEAMEWEAEYKSALLAQSVYLDEFYVSPAEYYVTRNLTNAFRKVINYNANPRDTLNRYCRDMQEELDRKRKEFGFD